MMRREIIVTTKPNGGVALTSPAAEIMAAMCAGGLWRNLSRGFIDRQIESKIAQGKDPDASRRLCHALAFGGCVDSEALAIIRDFDCLHLGTAQEIVNVAEIPQSRWFRDAWRRSHNGGPIDIEMAKARCIQLEKIKRAVRTYNRPRFELGRKPCVPLWGEIGNAIRHARDEDELRRVWPLLGQVQSVA